MSQAVTEARPLPPDTRLRARSTIEWIPASRIGRDERVNTRPADQAWVAKKAREFDWNYLGTIAVSRRDDGTEIPLDGQNRLALMPAIGQPDAEVKCEVFTGLSLAEEAALFLGLNAGRTVRPVSLFLAQVTMGDETAVEVSQIAGDCSWQIGLTKGRSVLQCVSTLTSIHARDRARKGSGEAPRVLRDTLTLITMTWGHDEEGGSESIVKGIGMVLHRDGTVLHGKHRFQGKTGYERLAAVLEDYRGPGDLLGQAKSMALTTRPQISTPKAVAAILVRDFNFNLSTHKLASFTR